MIGLVLALAALPTSAVVANGVRDPLIVSADINTSEWTPPMRLTLDLANGHWIVEPPGKGWPKDIEPVPAVRSGAISGPALIEIRDGVRRVLATDLADRTCDAARGNGYPPRMMSNAGMPHMTVTAGKRTLATSAYLACWTPTASALHDLLTKTFDRRGG